MITLRLLSILLFSTTLKGQIRRPDNIALYKPTYPSSYNNWNVNEGRRYVYYGKYFRTNYGSSLPQVMWFYIDLLKSYEIDHVIITSTDSSSGTDANRDFSIWCAEKFSNKNDVWANSMTLCDSQGNVALDRKQVKTYYCKNVCRGRYLVTTKQRMKKALYFNEVEVYEKGTIQNRALYRLAQQGSYYQSWAWSYRGTDGLEGAEWSGASIVHSEEGTGREYDYFAIDLGRTYRIFKMVILNRLETCCMDRLNKMPFEVRVADETFAQALKKDCYKLCYRRQKTQFIWRGELEFSCAKRTVGRIAMFYMRGANALPWTYNYCEFEVYAEIEEENLALGKPTMKIDEIGTTSQASRAAVDGITNTVFSLGSCIKTPGTSKTEWWAVDLQDTYVVRKVLLFGRLESAEGVCVGSLGVAWDIKKDRLPDSAFSASSYYRYYRYYYYPKSVRLSGYTYRGTDAWCAYYSSRTQWLQVDLGKLAIITGFTFESAYYYYYIRWFTLAYSTTSGGSFTALKDEGGNTIYLPGVDTYYNRIRMAWLPREIIARRLRFYPYDWYYKPCFRLEIHGCYDTVTELQNFKVKVAKNFDKMKYASNTFSTCVTQKGPLPKGHHKFMYCKPAAVGRYVVVEKDPANNAPLAFCEFEVYGQKHDGNLASFRTAKQSSTQGTYVAGLAVDGNKDTQMGRGSCSQTKASSKENWWSVDLGQEEEIGSVFLTSGSAGCEKTMRNISILTTNKFDSSNFGQNVFETCYHHKGIFQDGEVMTFSCQPGTKGRFLVLATPGAYPLTLCEVEVYPPSAIINNLALHKMAYQNNDEVGFSGSARLAVDGFRLTDPAKNSISLTSNAKLTWWSVDLQEKYHVRRMVIVNRDDEKSEWLADFQAVVTMAFSPHSINQVPHETCVDVDEALKPGEILSTICPRKAEGRYVIVRKQNYYPLSLCEVEVYGTKPKTNLALRKPAFMNTDILTSSTGSSASRATDGFYKNNFKYGSCSSTAGTKEKEWWAVNLQNEYYVDSVFITNRGDCCSYRLRKFYVSLMDQFNPFDFDSNWFHICDDQRKKTGGHDIQELRCPPASKGRHVLIVKEGAKNEPLALCEVEVYGKPLLAAPPSAGEKKINQTSFGPTLQSLAYYHAVSTSGLAVDGKRDLKPDSMCTKTDGKAITEWWNVDMNGFYNVSRVDVFTSPTASATKIQNLTLVVSDDFYPEDLNNIANSAYRTTAAPTSSTASTTSGSTGATTTVTTAASTTGQSTTAASTTTGRPAVSFTICNTFYGTIIPGQVIKFKCPKNLVGRYLTILKTPAQKDPLILCEVEMFGVLNKPLPPP